jgi:antitoxin YefM
MDKDKAVFVLSEEEYRSLLEMIYIYSIPGLVEKIKEGMNTPLEECSDELEWE